MVTLNISITDKQANLVDRLIGELGFANRSELFRALLRSIGNKAILRETIQTYPFAGPMTRDKGKIMSVFKETGKYSTSFLKDLKEGLDSSDYFT